MSEHARQPSGILMVTGAYFPELSGGGLQCKATIDALHGALRFTVLTTSTDASLPVVSEVDGTLVYRANVDVTSRWSKAKAAWAFLWSFLKLSGSFDIVHLRRCLTGIRQICINQFARHANLPKSCHRAQPNEIDWSA